VHHGQRLPADRQPARPGQPAARNAATVKRGYAYTRAGHLLDVTRWHNALVRTGAQLCGGDYLCAAGRGYDAPAGLGTPTASGAF
jgi:hypothetical protein